MTQLSSSNIGRTIENGNSFGRSIEFYEGASNQLLKYNERSRNENFGQIVFNPEALNVLRTIHEPLAIISVGIVGRGDIGKLCLTTELSKFVQESEVGDFLPRLVILLRDFT
ncbi:hypothetical protein C1646_662774 [Rhizophagus diaphanus]|nr:hypothetical protein C1646_662774 [Rhizophagus diaphanus] [Rhizophagus sp. MUCL 43196]